jgi:hypothetical protein
VTDGQVGNEDQVLRTLSRELGPTRVFALGIDKAVNESFLRRLAEMGRGAYDVVESEHRLDEVMTSIHRQIAAPLLTDLVLEPEGFTIERDSLVPERLPDLFAGSPALILGRFHGHPVGRLTVRATDAAQSPWSDQLAGCLRENPAIASAWARGQVRKLEDRYVIGRENLADLERQIVAVSLRFGVLCRFTAYVAIERDATANTTGVLHCVTQAVELPRGWGAQPMEARLLLECPAYMSPEASDTKAADVAGRTAASSVVKYTRRRSGLRRIARALALGMDDPAAAAPPPPPSTIESADDGPGVLSSVRTLSLEDLPDQYQIQRQIGRGGQGYLFEAFDKVRGHAVIVEVHRARYVRDGHKPPLYAILTSIRHPSLQSILEIVERGDQVFVIIDQVGPGKQLDEVVRESVPKPDVAARLVAEIAEAVQVLLDHGVLTQDIKPSRVFVTVDGRAILTDLASHLVRLEDAQSSGIAGTPAYVAPELIASSNGRHDGTTAVYSLGATLYELLTGVPPYTGRSTKELFDRVLRSAPPPPRRIRRSVPKPLESICLKAMARRPEDRHASPGELAAELRRFLNPEPARRRSFWKRS